MTGWDWVAAALAAWMLASFPVSWLIGRRLRHLNREDQP